MQSLGYTRNTIKRNTARRETVIACTDIMDDVHREGGYLVHQEHKGNPGPEQKG